MTFDVRAFEYFREREVIGPAERFAPNGRRQFIVSSDTVILEFEKPELIDAVRNRVNRQLLGYSAPDVAPKDLEGVFVERLLSTSSERVTAGFADDIPGALRLTRLTDILQQESKVTFIGRRECGKTTLANYIAVNVASFRLPLIMTACVIDCSKLRKRLTTAVILELATQFYSSHVAVRDIRRLASNGHMLFCFDGVLTDEPSLTRLLRSFAEQFPLAAVEPINPMGGQPIEEKSESTCHPRGKQMYIHTFRRRQTKELAQKWLGYAGGAARSQD